MSLSLPPLSEAIAPLREQINALDIQILALLNQRAMVALQVGHEKHLRHEPVVRIEREAQILENMALANQGLLKSEGIKAIWREIISACTAMETSTMVAYLGPSGTYSEQAVLHQFGHSCGLLPCNTIDDVFKAVEIGQAQFGVVPVENSTEGVVSRTLDLLLTSPLLISAEVVLPIHHHLLTQTGTLEGITQIIGHPQTLAQCQIWLNHHVNQSITRHAVSSNGEGARLASLDKTIAALAGSAAQERYHLMPVYQSVQDTSDNRTRFAIIGRHQTQPTQHPNIQDQTSLILSVPNEAGAMYRMLKPLADHTVSMTRFESRPAKKGGAWDYYFYVDIEGHSQEPHIDKALEALKQTTAFYKVLGSYPLSIISV